MKENLEKLMNQFEGENVIISEIGLNDEIPVQRLHSDIINNYITFTDDENEEQHIPRIPIEKVTNIIDDMNEFIIKTAFGIDFIFSFA